ncbi:MAG: Rpn family recombination-promoting nuclease/putative transposase, partial [Bacteroidaceae bacterium]|nr:Rpn family recombination-promoting nuclease/putative transposase [Bacteroidaceae bacterium]
MIDLDVLGKGRDYIELKKSYVIFICTFDPFDEGRRVYTFSNRCHESDGLELGDETTKLFLNAKGTIGEVDADIANFLDYVDGKTAEGKFTKDVAAEVDRVKQHDETRLEYMTLMMELKQQRREGQEEERRNTAIRMIKAGKLSLEEIAEYLALPLKSVAEIKNS